MATRFPLLFFATGLLAVGVLAYACGNDGETDEEQIRGTIRQLITRCNEGEPIDDLVRGPTCPPNAPNELVEFGSVTVDGDNATAEATRTDSSGVVWDDVLTLRKEEGRWVVHSVRGDPR